MIKKFISLFLILIILLLVGCDSNTSDNNNNNVIQIKDSHNSSLDLIEEAIDKALENS